MCNNSPDPVQSKSGPVLISGYSDLRSSKGQLEKILVKFQNWGCVRLRKNHILFKKIADWFDCVTFPETNYLSLDMGP